MSFSIYTSAFNVLNGRFPYFDALQNFCGFAEEVIVAVNKSEDNTLDAINLSFEELDNNGFKCKKKIVETDFSYEDPWLDGKIKNAALQQTTNKWKIGLDLDERIPLKAKVKWNMAAMILDRSPFDAYLIPSLNLWGDYYHIRWDSERKIDFKWYLHKEGLMRGPVNFGRKSDGCVDIEKSDTCELIYKNGDLVRATSLIDKSCYDGLENYLSFIRDNLFVFHLGYANFKDKVHRYETFWKKHWEVESGIEHNKPIEESSLGHHKVYLHGLNLWNQ